MITRIGDIVNAVVRHLHVNGSSIELHWHEWPANTPVDPVTGERQGTPVAKSETVRGFLHFVPATTTVRQFAEIEVGDCIADLPPDVQLEGREDLRFKINGEWWEAKEIGGHLGRAWDAVVQDHRLLRTVLLRKAT